MTQDTKGQAQAVTEETALISSEGSAYAVPVAVLEQFRIPDERRAQLVVEPPLYELPKDVLAPYRVSDEEVAALATHQPEPESDDDTRGHNLWLVGLSAMNSAGYSWNGSNFVYVGRGFDTRGWQPSSQPYPGLR